MDLQHLSHPTLSIKMVLNKVNFLFVRVVIKIRGFFVCLHYPNDRDPMSIEFLTTVFNNWCQKGKPKMTTIIHDGVSSYPLMGYRFFGVFFIMGFRATILKTKVLWIKFTVQLYFIANTSRCIPMATKFDENIPITSDKCQYLWSHNLFAMLICSKIGMNSLALSFLGLWENCRGSFTSYYFDWDHNQQIFKTLQELRIAIPKKLFPVGSHD